MPSDPADRDLLRAIYRNLDRQALMAADPSLTKERIDAFFRRVAEMLGPEEAPPVAAAGRVILHTDGGSRGNPGPAGGGIVIHDEAGRTILEKGIFFGRATSNEAEYRAFVEGLEAALRQGVSDILIRADSELLVRQVRGDYRVKSRNLVPLMVTVQGLLRRFKHWDIEHVRRELNARADELANQAMDRGKP